MVSFFFFLNIYLFICTRSLLAAYKLFSCGMWDLVPRPGIEPGSPALGAWSLSHWTTREVPIFGFLSNTHLSLHRETVLVTAAAGATGLAVIDVATNILQAKVFASSILH